MRITAIESFPVRIPLAPKRRMISALGRHDVSEFLIVRVATDAGLAGVGEASLTPRWSGETVWGGKVLVDRILGPALVGCDPRSIAEIDRRMESLCAHNWFVKSAIEMAAWDLAGQERGLPVFELLGGAVRGLTVRSRFSLGAYEPHEAARRARDLVEQGFTTIKVKVGGAAQDDLARVRSVREAIGDSPDLVIDANCGWSAETAIACVNALEDCRLSLVEQPTPDGDYAAMAAVRQNVKPPIMADDMCFNLVHAKELVRNRCCDVISVYPGKNGGIGRTKQIVEFAAQHGVACSIGSNLEWDVATAAMAHVVVACPNVQVEKYPGDMLGPSYHEHSIAKEPLSIEGPFTTITSKPGLGVTVDWEAVRRYACE